MHTRERGAAHVNIFFFLIMLVLFLGATGFAYVQMGENNTLRESIAGVTEQNRQLAADIELREHYVEDISKLLGELGEYKGREGFVYKDPDDANDREPKPLAGCSVPRRVEDAILAFANQTTIPASTAKPLASLFGEAKKVLDTKDQRVTDALAQATTLQTQVNEAQASVAEANRLRTDEVGKRSTELTEFRQQVDAEWRRRDNLIAGLRGEVDKSRQEKDQLREDHAKQVTDMTKDKNTLMARIDAQRQLTELVNPPQEADGAVISSSEVANRAWINLGRNDMLARGTVFQITAANKDTVKGYGRVTSVEPDRAEIELYDIKDQFNPITKGDRVSNELYSPKLRRNVYLMGRFSYPLTKPTVKLVLEQLGNRVTDKLGPGVDLVLVGGDTITEEGDGFTPIADTAEYKEALALRIEMATVNKVRDFLKLGE